MEGVDKQTNENYPSAKAKLANADINELVSHVRVCVRVRVYACVRVRVCVRVRMLSRCSDVASVVRESEQAVTCHGGGGGGVKAYELHFVLM